MDVWRQPKYGVNVIEDKCSGYSAILLMHTICHTTSSAIMHPRVVRWNERWHGHLSHLYHPSHVAWTPHSAACGRWRRSLLEVRVNKRNIKVGQKLRKNTTNHFKGAQFGFKLRLRATWVVFTDLSYANFVHLCCLSVVRRIWLTLLFGDKTWLRF